MVVNTRELLVLLLLFLPIGLNTLTEQYRVPQIVHTLPHPIVGYTQGLVWSQGSLYESVGLYGQSEVRQIDADTGSLRFRRFNSKEEFGEGLAIKDNTLVQLTWREGYALRLTAPGLKPIEGRWSFTPEGWGLTWMPDKKLFVRSDGSSVLHFHNATDFSETGTLQVRRAGIPVPNLNELEYAKGSLFANIYGVSAEARRIIEINPASGDVTAEIDLEALCKKEKVTFHRELNGIAYNPEQDVFYITGKNWDFIYAVRW